MDISFQTPLGGALFALFTYGLTLGIALFVAAIVYALYRLMRNGKAPGSDKRAG